MEKPVMYILANQSLNMSHGKIAAQVAHAAVRSAVSDLDYVRLHNWLDNGETKIVLAARDAEHMLTAETYINNRGYKTYTVIDEGRTEIPPLSKTAMAVQLVDKSDPHVQTTFETFKTYKAPKSKEPEPDPKENIWIWWR
jgi:PTH2 family peptidyl-tRNA hydrolase